MGRAPRQVNHGSAVGAGQFRPPCSCAAAPVPARAERQPPPCAIDPSGRPKSGGRPGIKSRQGPAQPPQSPAAPIRAEARRAHPSAKPSTTHPGAKPGTTHEQRDRRERFERARRDSLRPDDLAVLYGWHTVKAALENPARKVRKFLATENAARRLTEEGVTAVAGAGAARRRSPNGWRPMRSTRGSISKPIPCPRPISPRSPARHRAGARPDHRPA